MGAWPRLAWPGQGGVDQRPGGRAMSEGQLVRAQTMRCWATRMMMAFGASAAPGGLGQRRATGMVVPWVFDVQVAPNGLVEISADALHPGPFR
jgi:hypothetical protein